MSHKPRGRKPRRTPTPVFRAQTLWGFGQRYGGQSSQASGANVPLRLDGDWRNCDGAPFAGSVLSSGAPLAAPGTHQPRRGAQAHRHPRQVMVQGSVHDGGGARMACPRMRQCRMVIAWPQCRQTKVGGAALGRTSACLSLLGVAATWPGATSNN